MHKLIEYICDEMEQLERKADKEGKLSMSEMQYADMLAHLKKNILTSDAMMDAEDEYSNESGNSYARGDRRGRGRNARRDSMGRYSRESMNDNRDGSYERGYSRADAKENLMMELRELEQDAGDEETRYMIKKWIKQLEQG